MRLEAKIKVRVGGIVIGGPKVLICLPLVAEDRSRLLSQAQQLIDSNPDLLEWRIDGYQGVEDIASSLDALKALRSRIGSTPLIFTCRCRSEGGAKKLAPAHRLNLITSAIRSKLVDIVDVEMRSEADFIDSVKREAEAHGTKLILSYHDFDGTPDEAVICDTLKQMASMGADIAKLAVMPNGYEDVLTLLSATCRARTQEVQIPIVTMSMDDKGRVTRIAGGLFGSDITFAMGSAVSAPGQIHIDRLRAAMKAVYTPK